MDSYNNGTNKIVPIETIENGISSNLEIRNQIVPPPSTFRNSDNRQISNTTDIKTKSIHYISWIFGILLTIAALSSALIVPWHNVLKEPFYFYEIYVYSGPPWLAILVAVYIIRLEYWACIKYENKLTLFIFLFGIGAVLYAINAVSYFYVYVYYFELTAPPPYAGIYPGMLAAYILIPILYFRYNYANDTFSINPGDFSKLFSFKYFCFLEYVKQLSKIHILRRGLLIWL